MQAATSILVHTVGEEWFGKSQRESNGNVERPSHIIDFLMARECGGKVVELIALFMDSWGLCNGPILE